MKSNHPGLFSTRQQQGEQTSQDDRNRRINQQDNGTNNISGNIRENFPSLSSKFRTPASLTNNNNNSARLYHPINSTPVSKRSEQKGNSSHSSASSPAGNSAGIIHQDPIIQSSNHPAEKTGRRIIIVKQQSSLNTSRRIFTPEFKRTVVNAFAHDPECFGNQRATARKFRIHRRQVQKWIQQTATTTATAFKVHNSDAACESAVRKSTKTTKASRKKSPSPQSSTVMANAINTLLSLRDAVRIKAPWSPQSSSSSSNISAAALNLGLLSNSAALLHDMDPSPPQSSTPTGNKNNGTPGRHDRSPRISPQSSTSMSPSTRTNGQYPPNGNSSGDHDPLTTSEIIDELSYIYPQEDFTILRKACLKNEITLTKLSSRLSFGYPSPSNGNGSGGGLKEDFMTQQTLQLLKQQNEYVQMLQQSGVNLFHGDVTSSLNLAGLTDSHSNSKYSTWFHPLAQAAAAAAAGISLPSTSTNGSNGTSGGGNGKKKPANDHMFLSPKTPALSSSKPKTVAAALAASRHSPNIIGNLSGLGNGKVKKPALPRKRNSRPKSSTITRPSLVMQDDDIDPSSMVETTTTIPAEYGGMDLSSSGHKESDFIGGKRLIKQEPPFLYPEVSQEEPVDIKPNGHNLLNAASLTLENYLRNVMPTKKSPTNGALVNGGFTDSTRASPPAEPAVLSESDKKKQQVLEAFNDDEEVAGDARGVARKFGLNIRVVLKWLREGPSKSLPALPSTLAHQKSNNGGIIPSILTSVANLPIEQALLTNGDHVNNNNNISNNNNKKNLPNKRKNTKPNQICDFQDDDLPDDSDAMALDMVVPIKKRRVSNSNASS